MTRKDWAAKEISLNRAALEWSRTSKAEEDADAHRTMWQEVILLSFELYDEQFGITEEGWVYERDPMVFMDTLEEALTNYDAAKGPFSRYLSFLMKRRRVDQLRYDGRHNPGDRYNRKNLFLNAALDSEEKDGETFEAMLPSKRGEEGQAEANSIVCELLTIMLELPKRLHGKANNPARLNYFRLFFTDTTVRILHETDSAAEFTRHERDLFRAIKVRFLDYIMRERCRSAAQIAVCALKGYGELADGRPLDKEPPQPLPLDVFETYMDRVEGLKAGASAISQQRTAYIKFLKETLSC